MIQVLLQYHHLLLGGFATTLELLGCIMLIGIPFGVVFGIVGGRYNSSVGIALTQARFVTKVVPVLVFLFWLHYPLQAILGIVVNPFVTTVFALGLINMISVGHIIQVELELLPKSYREAGITLGLTKNQVIKYIELPLLIRRTAPQLLLVQASMLEYTLFASLISVPELFRVTQTINSMLYKPVAIYSLLVLFFVMILVPLHLCTNWIQKKYATQYA